jgi:hypothetical protein
MSAREPGSLHPHGGTVAVGETLLLVSEREPGIIPIAPLALRWASGSKAAVRRRSVGALVMDRHGAVRRIESIEFIGPFGEGTWQKILSRLNSDWAIAPVLSAPLPQELEATKLLIARCLEADARRPEPYLAPEVGLEPMLRALAGARSMAEVFHALQVPLPENSLDSL